MACPSYSAQWLGFFFSACCCRGYQGLEQQESAPQLGVKEAEALQLKEAVQHLEKVCLVSLLCKHQ